MFFSLCSFSDSLNLSMPHLEHEVHFEYYREIGTLKDLMFSAFILTHYNVLQRINAHPEKRTRMVCSQREFLFYMKATSPHERKALIQLIPRIAGRIHWQMLLFKLRYTHPPMFAFIFRKTGSIPCALRKHIWRPDFIMSSAFEFLCYIFFLSSRFSTV